MLCIRTGTHILRIAVVGAAISLMLVLPADVSRETFDAVDVAYRTSLRVNPI